MGLLLDEDAIPITYRLFEGNTHDSQTFMPLVQETRKSYGLGRIITVADKALNSGDNVAFLMAKEMASSFRKEYAVLTRSYGIRPGPKRIQGCKRGCQAD